jgi:hypothetical protein
MSLEASFKSLCECLHRAHDELEELHRAAFEKPLKGDVVLVDLFGDAADDLLGWIAEASTAAREAAQASGYPLDLDRARQSLKSCQETFMLASEKLSTDLLSYDRIEELMSFGRERGGRWLGWARDVKGAVEACRGPFSEVNQALFSCWQELTERIGTTSVSVKTTNVGQQITVPAREFAREGVP